MKLATHVSFNGNCEAAFKFYEKAIGARIKFLMYFEGSPMAEGAPPELLKKVLHATLQVGDFELSGDDFPGDKKYHSALEGNVLGDCLRRGHRSVRHSVDGELREAHVTLALKNPTYLLP